MDAVFKHISEIISFLTGLAGGSLLTLYFKNQRVNGRGRVVDQSKARAGGDVVGGDKLTGNGRLPD
jgi:hypothetical protein